MKGSLEGKEKGTSVVRVVRVGTEIREVNPVGMLVRLRQAPCRLIVVRAGSFPREAKCVRPVSSVTLSKNTVSAVTGNRRSTHGSTTRLPHTR